jgi:hypothetical protein
MGGATLPLNSLSDGKETERRLTLTGDEASGSILLKVLYTSASKLAANGNVAASHSDELIELLVNPADVIIVCALADVYQNDELARTLVSLFEANHQAHRLLNQLLYREIKRTEHAETLFRTDSMATKATRNYLRLVAGGFLHGTLSAGVTAALACASKCELDPTQGGAPGNAGALADVCRKALQPVLSALTAGAAVTLPSAVRGMLGGASCVLCGVRASRVVQVRCACWCQRNSTPTWRARLWARCCSCDSCVRRSLHLMHLDW